MVAVSRDGETAKSLNLPLVPMIDVFMNLLCFFLIAGHFREVERQMESNLPRLGPPHRDDGPLKELWIRIQRGGEPASPAPQIIVQGRPLSRWEDVEASLARYSRAEGARTGDRVILAPDPDAEHGWVMRALGIVQGLGFRDINFRR